MAAPRTDNARKRRGSGSLTELPSSGRTAAIAALSGRRNRARRMLGQLRPGINADSQVCAAECLGCPVERA